MKVYIGKYKKGGKGRTERVEVSSEDTYSLDYTLALVILPALKEYKKQACGRILWTNFYPDNFIGNEQQFTKAQRKKIHKQAEKKLEEVLDKMIWSFEQILEDCAGLKSDEFEKVQEGLDLFGKYYRFLWW